MSYRNIWISAGIAMTIIVAGSLLLRNAGEAPVGAMALVGMVTGIVVLHVLDARELRQGKSD